MSEKNTKIRGKSKPVSEKGNVKLPPSKGLNRTPRRKHSREIPPEDLYRRIAEAAYFLAERRGFENGRCEEDWYEAERLIMNQQER